MDNTPMMSVASFNNRTFLTKTDRVTFPDPELEDPFKPGFLYGGGGGSYPSSAELDAMLMAQITSMEARESLSAVNSTEGWKGKQVQDNGFSFPTPTMCGKVLSKNCFKGFSDPRRKKDEPSTSCGVRSQKNSEMPKTPGSGVGDHGKVKGNAMSEYRENKTFGKKPFNCKTIDDVYPVTGFGGHGYGTDESNTESDDIAIAPCCLCWIKCFGCKIRCQTC